jgi:hypothetical protein
MDQPHHDSTTIGLFSGENPGWMAQIMVDAPPKMLLKGYDRPIPHVTRRDTSVSFGLAWTLSGCQIRRKEIAEFVTPTD